jgi:hypothetical protein
MKTETTHTHTPGPWRIDSKTPFGDHTIAAGNTVAKCEFIAKTQSHGNARLIAAAPELLQVAQDFVLLAALHDWQGAAIDFAKATVLKAEGNA